VRKGIDLSAALAAAEHHEAQELIFFELVRAWGTVVLDGSDLRLRGWVAARGDQSAWASENIDL